MKMLFVHRISHLGENSNLAKKSPYTPLNLYPQFLLLGQQKLYVEWITQIGWTISMCKEQPQ